MSDIQRFEELVTETPQPDVKCWLWQGAVNNRGYGMFRLNGKTCLAHRVSYKLYRGPIQNGMFVLHRCDVRQCVNPKHLFIGTAKDNTQDMISKSRGRWARGERAAKSKFTWEQICDIRKRYSTGKRGILKQLYTEFKVTKNTILNIVKGRTWKRRK